MKRYILLLSGAVVALTACNKDFLNKVPATQFTTQTAFVNYQNFQTYSWGLYDYLAGYGNGGATEPPAFTQQEKNNSDNLNAGGQSGYVYQTKLIPATATGGTTSLQMADWNFSYIRRVNVMLDNIDQSTMVQSDKDHWRSVGYFFRALRYYDLIAAYGDVPWVEHALSDTSNSVLYGTRTSRDTVAQNILNNLVWAESHIKPAGDGANTINQDCVDFLISRFGLFEGTWRKYHGLSNANTYLQACVTYSQKLLPKYPGIMSSYDDVFNSEDLKGKAGIILFKQYVNTVFNNPMLTRYTGSTSWSAEVTRDAVQSFLCKDGRPIATSAVYQGNDSMYAEFKNRDKRLYFNVMPPYSVKFINTGVTNQAGNSDNLWAYDPNPDYGYFVHYMNDSLAGNIGKRLPVISQTNDMKSGNVIPNFPHFNTYNVALSHLPAKVAISQMVGTLGYYYWKYYNRLPMDGSSNYGGTQDCPLFRIEETMLNYAEAMFELGQFNQGVADVTINKLRPRAGVSNMVVANIDGSFDPQRDPSVDPVLWEIRRERRVELFGDGFRFNDLKRWMKGSYMNKYPYGVKVYDKNRMYPNVSGLSNANIKLDGGGNSGYVINPNVSTVIPGWLDKYYLEPIPAQELTVNPNLVQTIGWK
ncbi:RagB/SusD family nutrient uptake outer membrane protein [Chitinophagaceae bacterium 26-R-25]|nr:RagB/SusD family nutrient uptake outer membrane protein [Chitinophagaceae bacterium 26-R-25]